MGFIGKHHCYSFNCSSIRKNAPPLSGVYGLSNARQWIFIGEADDVQAALLGCAAEIDAGLHGAAPTGFTFELCQPGARFERATRLRLDLSPSRSQPAEG